MTQSRTVCLAVLLALSTHSALAFDYDESVQGDLSGDQTNPDFFILDAGANTLAATTTSGDVEYFTLTVPADHELQSILLTEYSRSFGSSFLGVQTGAEVTVPVTTLDASDLLGYVLFNEVDHLGTDILDDIAMGPGSMQFVPPLPAGQYAFWAQETSFSVVSYAFQFNVAAVPEPTLSCWFLLAVAGFTRRIASCWS